jgi:hypothetical protein
MVDFNPGCRVERGSPQKEYTMTTSHLTGLRLAALLPVALLVLAAGCKDSSTFSDTPYQPVPSTTEPATQNAPASPMTPPLQESAPAAPIAPPAPEGAAGGAPAQ